MNPTEMSPNDPKLTAYALGELDGDEQAAVAAAIAGNPLALKTVAEIRALSAHLEAALADEPIDILEPVDEPTTVQTNKAPVVRFPLYWVGGLAAACFALLLLVRPSPTGDARLASANPAETSEQGQPAITPQVVKDAHAVALDVARFRRLPQDSLPEVNPSPAVADGYQLGRTVVSTDAGPARNGDEALSRVRQFLQNGQLPPPDAVNIEGMLNYFAYGSTAPGDRNPIGASIEVAAAPWNPSNRLVRIGLKDAESSSSLVSEDVRLAAADARNAAKPGASDVNLQVEFNPEQAKSYRLIGYEETMPRGANRQLAHSEPSALPAGHVVTALYEVVPVGGPEPIELESEAMRVAAADETRSRELLTLKVHYKVSTVDVSRKLEIPLIDPGTDFSKASKDFKFAAAVAGFGMLLKESPHKGTATYDQILTWAEEGQDKDNPAERRTEFIDLVKRAKKAAVE